MAVNLEGNKYIQSLKTGETWNGQMRPDDVQLRQNIVLFNISGEAASERIQNITIGINIAKDALPLL